MKKRMTIMIIFLVVIFGGVFGWDALRLFFMNRFFAHYQPPPSTISTAVAEKQKWNSSYKTVGTFVAVNGVSVSPEVAGIITQINFNSGDMVKQGQLLFRLDDSVDQANLKNDEASFSLANLNFQRNQKLFQRRIISASEDDHAKAKLQQAEAAVEGIEAQIAHKYITAPFSGKVGIRQINLGQYVSPGTPLVSLQAISPIYVNFYLPEQYLPKIFVGQTVDAKVDMYPKEIFSGKISAINSQVDSNTYSIQIQATFSNSNGKLYPGIFANLTIKGSKQYNATILPSTAITFSLFGNTVFILEPQTPAEKDASGKEIYTVKQQFVRVGEQTGSHVVILSGVKPGQQVVSSGQNKLLNGSRVVINNSVTLDQTQNEIY